MFVVWGVNDGGYLFWLIIGLCMVCDMVGWVVDIYVDLVLSVSLIFVCNSVMVFCFVDICVSFLLFDWVIEEVVFDKYLYICDVYI